MDGPLSRLKEVVWPRGVLQPSYYTRYAFHRPRRQRIMVNHPQSEPLVPEDLEVAGLADFLRATAPKVDFVVADRR